MIIDNEFFMSMVQIELMINSHDESVGKYVMVNRVYLKYDYYKMLMHAYCVLKSDFKPMNE